MAFRVYAGASGQKTQSWHRDCGANGTEMAIDVGASVGTSVRFTVHNDGTTPIVFRYRVDCTTFPRGIPSSVMVEGDVGADEYLFRYTHLDVASDIPRAGGPWSDWTAVQPGRTAGKVLAQSALSARRTTLPVGLMASAASQAERQMLEVFVPPDRISTKQRQTANAMAVCRHAMMDVADTLAVYSRHTDRSRRTSRPALSCTAPEFSSPSGESASRSEDAQACLR